MGKGFLQGAQRRTGSGDHRLKTGFLQEDTEEAKKNGKPRVATEVNHEKHRSEFASNWLELATAMNEENGNNHEEAQKEKIL